MGDPQGDLRPGTPILVGFFTEISKKWVLDSKTPLVEPPRGGGGGGGGGRGSDSLVKFCPVFVFFTIRPFPGHPRVNPAPKIGFLGPVGLNSPSRYPKI